MENTGSLLFDHTSVRYFLITTSATFGPISAEEVFATIERGEASLMDHLWRPGWTDFKRICDEKEFAVLVPKKPNAKLIGELQLRLAEVSRSNVKQAPPPTPVSWYLFHNKSQYGPFSEQELTKIVESGKVDASAYMWMPGWANWKPIAEVEEFSAKLPKAPAAISPRAEKTASKTLRADRRGAPRKPLIARLFVSNNADVIVAVCRDISMGGMQVLTDRVPGTVGEKVKLNVSPADTRTVKGFVAEGEIVRILEDGRGFSFRFTKISSDAKKTIEKYIT